ncbi:transcriptional repressor LexA [Chloroflexota bacterium]
MKRLSNIQKQIIDFIEKFIKKYDYSPSVRDVARGCSIASSTVTQYHLNILEREGYISRGRKVSRSISLLKRQSDFATVPLLGTISAGVPIPVPNDDTWVQIADENLIISKEITEGLDNIYALKVKGTSMIDALIDDGDIILVQQTHIAEDGDMVAVWLNDRQEVTLKKIYRKDGKICLQPANKLMETLYCKPDDVEIQSKVVGVIRKL